MCTPCCNEPPFKFNIESDNDCKCNCSSTCFSFFRRRSLEPPTPTQLIALRALADKHEASQTIIEPKRVKKRIKVKKTPRLLGETSQKV